MAFAAKILEITKNVLSVPWNFLKDIYNRNEYVKRKLAKRKKILRTFSLDQLINIARNYGVNVKYYDYGSRDPFSGRKIKRAGEKLKDYGQLVNDITDKLNREQFDAVLKRFAPEYIEEYYEEDWPEEGNYSKIEPQTKQTHWNQQTIDLFSEVISSYAPPRFSQMEETYEFALKERIESRLNLPLNAIRSQYRIGKERIDLADPSLKIAIEVKNQPQTPDIERLIGQVHIYTSYGFYLFVVIFRSENKNAIYHLLNDLKKYNLPVCLIVDGKIHYKY